MRQKQFKTFCLTHPYKQRLIHGQPWEYILCGQRAETLLMLPGAPGLGDTAFDHIEAMEAYYRILSPSYPAGIHTLEGLVDGLMGLLDAEGIERVHVIGGSYSGMVAQCLARRYPKRVGKMVLSHTGLPHKNRALFYMFVRVLVLLLPMGLIRSLLYLCQRALYQEVNRSDVFWPAYFRRVIAQLSKADYLARLAVQIDFDQHYHFGVGELADKCILIIESDNDTLVSKRERIALKALYPHAVVYTFRQTGHSAWVTQQEHYLQLMLTFLQEDE